MVPARSKEARACATASTHAASTSNRRLKRREDLMAHLIRAAQPRLRRPVLLAAFEGWNDAGDAATFAVRFLADRWEATPFASIDPEEFFDFTSTRPMVRLDDNGQREIVWPT